MIGEIALILFIAAVAGVAALLKSRLVRSATENQPQQEQEQEQGDQQHDASR